MPSFLVFDTETTGLPLKDPHTRGRFFYQPWMIHKYDGARLVQIAWSRIDEHGRVLSRTVHLVRPDGFHIPAESTRIHRISHEQAACHGHCIADVLVDLNADVSLSDMLVAHNITFDRLIVLSEAYRLKKAQTSNTAVCAHVEQLIHNLRTKPRYDTMIEGQRQLGLSKWPRLIELHSLLHPRARLDAGRMHDAMQDTLVAKKCFLKLCLQPRARAARLASLRPRSSIRKPQYYTVSSF